MQTSTVINESFLASGGSHMYTSHNTIRHPIRFSDTVAMFQNICTKKCSCQMLAQTQLVIIFGVQKKEIVISPTSHHRHSQVVRDRFQLSILVFTNDDITLTQQLSKKLLHQKKVFAQKALFEERANKY